MLFLRLRAAAVDGDLSLVELSPQATSLTPHAAVSLRYGPGDAAGSGRRPGVRGHATGRRPATTDALAEARRLVGAEPVVVVVGPAVAGRGRRAGGRRRPGAGRALPGARFLPGAAPGQRARAPSTWGWPRASCPAGCRSRTAGPGSRRPGDRCPERRGAGRPTSWPPRPATRPTAPRSTRPGAARRRPAGRLPRPAPGPTGARGCRVRGGRGHRAGRRARPRRRGAAGRRGPRAARGRPPTSRAASPGWARSWCRPGQAWPDWMIAGELAVHLGTRPRASTRSATVWDEIEQLAVSHRGITRAVLDAPGAADGVVAPLRPSPVALARRSAPARPDGRARRGVGRAPGRPASRPDWPRPPTPADSAATDGPPDAVRAGPPGRAVGAGRTSTVPHVSPGRRLLGPAGGVPGPLRRRARRCRSVPSLAGLVAPGSAAGQPPRPRRAGCGRRRPGAPALGHGHHGGPGRARPVGAPQGGGRRLQRARWATGTVADLIDRAFPVVDLRMETL